jgi:hypothetical protein
MAESFHEMLLYRYTNKMLTFLQEQQKKHEEKEVQKQVRLRVSLCFVSSNASWDVYVLSPNLAFV